MSENASPTPSNQIPQGLVWAFLLLGIAAVIGAVAMLLWVVNTPRGTVVVGDGQVASTPVSGDGDESSAGATSAGGLSAEPTAAAGESSPAMPGPGMDAPTPASDTLVVEDWASYADDEALAGALTINEGWAKNSIVLALLPATASPHGPAGVAVGYEITAVDPNDYVGFEWDVVPAQDWRGYGELVTWAQSTDATERQLVLQFHEWSGEVWRHRVALKGLPANGEIRIPLAQDQWQWADWSERQNKQLDLHEITRLGLFVGHSGPGAGEMRLGHHRAAPVTAR